MLIVISPAKALDYDSKLSIRKHTQAEFGQQTSRLVKKLKTLKPKQLSKLMHISDALGELNYNRYQEWQPEYDLKNSRQAIFAFKGDVYQGLNAQQFSAADLNFAQKHLRILSGLYGVLRPLDLMQPYRLEMGTGLKTTKGANLYDYWGDQLSEYLNEELATQRGKSKVLVNLASNEYFNAIKPEAIDADIVTPTFKDFSKGKYKFIMLFAKQARGTLAAYIIKNRIKSPEQLKDFKEDGYKFSEADSTEDKYVFLRKRKK